MKSLSIGQVARQASVGVETVRFYERQGLLEKPPVLEMPLFPNARYCKRLMRRRKSNGQYKA